MIKPGSLQLKKGKWLVGTRLNGFRPQNLVLDYKTIRQFLWKIMIGSSDPLLASRIQHWIDLLNDVQTDQDVREVVRQIKYYSGDKNPETTTQKRLAEICGWLNYMCMQITSCPEPKPFTPEEVAKRIRKESLSAPTPLIESRMIHWSEQVINLNFLYVQKEMERYATVKPSNPFERTLKAMSGWMKKLETEKQKEAVNG